MTTKRGPGRPRKSHDITTVELKGSDTGSDEDDVYLPKSMPKVAPPKQPSPVRTPSLSINLPSQPTTQIKKPTTTIREVQLELINERIERIKASATNKSDDEQGSPKKWSPVEQRNACLASHLPLLIDSHNRFVDAVKHALETLSANGHGCADCRIGQKEN